MEVQLFKNSGWASFLKVTLYSLCLEVMMVTVSRLICHKLIVPQSFHALNNYEPFKEAALFTLTEFVHCMK